MAIRPFRSARRLKVASRSLSASSLKTWARSAGCCFCSRFSRLAVAPMRSSRLTESRTRSILRCDAMVKVRPSLLNSSIYHAQPVLEAIFDGANQGRGGRCESGRGRRCEADEVVGANQDGAVGARRTGLSVQIRTGWRLLLFFLRLIAGRDGAERRELVFGGFIGRS